MSVENGKVCCNCRHNIRHWDNDYCHCECEVTKEYLGYVTVMSYWCRQWAKERKGQKARKNEKR